jgi:hypothetical protein
MDFRRYAYGSWNDNGYRVMDTIDNVYGYTEGLCAWCLSAKAKHSYVGIMSGGEEVRYHVCDMCNLDRPNAR